MRCTYGKKRLTPFGIAAFLWISGLGIPLPGNAGVNADITILLPGLVIPALPAMIVIPGTYVYYPPNVLADIFFIMVLVSPLSRPLVHISWV